MGNQQTVLTKRSIDTPSGPQAFNRAVMLIGDGRETNPTSEVFACVESIEDVVGKLVCTDCQGYGTLPNTQSHTCRNAYCVKARGFFWSACDCLAYQTHVILWSKDGQTTAKNKRASLHQIDWNVATEGAQPA